MHISPFSQGFGAEVSGTDLSGATPAGDVAELQRAYDEHQLLVFRGDAAIPPERQVEIAGWFGPTLEEDGKRWTLLRNVTSEGRVRLPFHSDLTYTESPVKGITLHSTALPASGTETWFVSGVVGWATLPAATQDRLAATTVTHRHDRSVMATPMPTFVQDHPVRFLHPRTGRPVLFVTEWHASRILELGPEESDRVLAELRAHLYAPERVYVHQWRLHDLLIWDNLAIQHSRPQEAALDDGPRVLQRVALADVGYAELTDRARERERRQGQPVA